jgi:uncharacterized membrane protein
MTSSNGDQQQSGGGLMGALRNNPALGQLGDAARDYAKARGQDAVKKVGDKLSGVTGSLTDTADSGGFKATAVTSAVKRVAEGDSPIKASLGGVGEGIKEKVKSAFGKSGGAGGNKKFVSIIEDISVGVPVDVAYNQWTQFQEFASFTKGVESVDQTDEVSSNWRVKVFKSRRNWKASVTEQVPDRRIAWTSEGAKGTTKGVVTFHPLADDLTQVLLVIEYYPQGLFEKTGNIWRAGGRRARLDLKHFRRFVMMRGEETGSWRGEIRDGEVVRSPEEVEQEEQENDSAEDQDQEDQENQDDRQASNGRVDAAASEGQDDSDEDDSDEDYEEDEDQADEDQADEDYEDDGGEGEEEPAEEPAPARGRRRRQPAGAR